MPSPYATQLLKPNSNTLTRGSHTQRQRAKPNSLLPNFSREQCIGPPVTSVGLDLLMTGWFFPLPLGRDAYPLILAGNNVCNVRVLQCHNIA